MLALLSLAGFMLAICLGYLAPRRAGWIILLVAPVLGPATFTLVSSSLFPLTIYRIAFGVTVGMVLRHYGRRPIFRPVVHTTFVKILLAFSLFVIIVSVGDRLTNLVFTYIPELLLAILLPFLLVNSEKDLQRFATILVWQAALIGGFVILEFFTDFDVSVALRSTIPEADLQELQAKQFVYETRAGFFRPSGIDGNAVQTGYRMAFLFPLTLWYTSRGALWRSVPVILAAAGLALLQTRAAFVAIGLALLLLAGGLLMTKGTAVVRKFRYLFRLLLFLALTFVVLTRVSPSITHIASTSIQETLIPILRGDLQIIDEKVNRVPLALEYFWQKPILGHGSPQFVYFEVMDTQDIPSPLIYLLSGGILLGAIFLLLLYYIVYSTARLARSKRLNPRQKEFVTYAAAAFAAGVIVVFSNWQEAHFMIMYMLYMAIIRVYATPFSPAAIIPPPTPSRLPHSYASGRTGRQAPCDRPRNT